MTAFDSIRCFGGPLDGQTRPLVNTVIEHFTGLDTMHAMRHIYMLRAWVMHDAAGDGWAYACAYFYDEPGRGITSLDEAGRVLFGGGYVPMEELEMGRPFDFVADTRSKGRIVDAARAWFAVMAHRGDATHERRLLVDVLADDAEAKNHD